MGTVLALDVGERRIGVARADLDGRLATPLLVLKRHSVRKDADRLARVCAEQQAEAVVVGLSHDDQGRETRTARLARQVAEAVSARTHLPIHYQDEGYTTYEASRRLEAAGGRRRGQPNDDAAAAIILQDWLDAR